jgi:oligopeptide/dipeptide ABC transporter ATP-binding protein
VLQPAIPGAPPDPADPPPGCRFHPRCHLAREICTHGDLELHPVGEEHESACLFAPFAPTPVGGALR